MDFAKETRARFEALRSDTDRFVSRRALAEEAGVGYEWLRKYEREPNLDPQISNLQKIFDLFEREYQWK